MPTRGTPGWIAFPWQSCAIYPRRQNRNEPEARRSRSLAELRRRPSDDAVCGDGKLDIIFSNEKEYGIYLFENMEKGWSRKLMAGKREDKDALPMISRGGTNNGFWVHSGHLWWSNEDTVLLKDHVDRRAIKELLKMVR
jgi:hypothetical protein